jgi:iron-sulfur cluster repair protein YtfE (RIC family)
MIINPALTVAEIMELYPETRPVFVQYRIDLCCGGRLALADVARTHGIDLKKLIEELLAARLVGA